MERDWLAAQLESGRSIEAIAAEVGRHASTVAYWAEKHGLRSVHAERHAARGGIPRDMLTALVDEGLTVRAIAARVDRSTATVRHWLKRYGLTTRRVRARVDPDGAFDGFDREGALVGDCPRHGRTRFIGSAPTAGSAARGATPTRWWPAGNGSRRCSSPRQAAPAGFAGTPAARRRCTSTMSTRGRSPST
jgi:transposase